MRDDAFPPSFTALKLPTILVNVFDRLGLDGVLLVRRKNGTRAPARDRRDAQKALDHIADAVAAVADLLDIFHPGGDPDHAGGATEVGEACNTLARHGFGPLATPSRKIQGRPKREG